jgi:hypothetical protein
VELGKGITSSRQSAAYLDCDSPFFGAGLRAQIGWPVKGLTDRKGGGRVLVERHRGKFQQQRPEPVLMHNVERTRVLLSTFEPALKNGMRLLYRSMVLKSIEEQKSN